MDGSPTVGVTRFLTVVAAVLAVAGASATVAACSDDDPLPAADGGAQVDATTPVDGSPPRGDGSSTSDGGLPDDCREDSGPYPTAPTELRCTGLYGDWATKTVAASVRPYTPGLVFFSDGAEKSRWVAFPAGTTINTANMNEWTFPEGTKVWKEFRLGGERVETRFLWKVGDGEWVRTTYRWSEGGTQARRLDSGEQNVGGTKYEIPETGRCGDCHGGRKDFLLGVEAISLALPAAQGLTLASLKQEGLLSAAPAVTQISLPEDTTGKAADALGYLHVNCGESCHNKNPGAGASFIGFHMRLDAIALFGNDGGLAVTDTDTWKTGMGVRSTLSPFDGLGYRRLAPGDLDHTLAYHLATATREDAGERVMPPVGRNTVDDAGPGKLAAWVTALPSDAGSQDGGPTN